MSLPEMQEVPLKKTVKRDREHPSMTAKIKYQRDKERQMIRGKFIYHEVPGGYMSFVFQKYPGDEVTRYDMYDGEIYTIPLSVYKHLNENGWYPVHKYAVDDMGKSTMKIGQKVRRFSFQSLEFLDPEDEVRHADIVTVEKV